MLILSVANSAFLHFWHVRLIARPRKNSLIVRDPALGPWEPHLPLKTIFLHAEGDLKDNPHTFSRGQICKMIGELKNKQDYFQWKNLRSRFRSSWQTFGRHKSIRKTLPTKKIKFKKTAVEKLVQSLDFLFCFKALIAFWQKCCETEIFCVSKSWQESLMNGVSLFLSFFPAWEENPGTFECHSLSIIWRRLRPLSYLFKLM